MFVAAQWRAVDLEIFWIERRVDGRRGRRYDRISSGKMHLA